VAGLVTLLAAGNSNMLRTGLPLAILLLLAFDCVSGHAQQQPPQPKTLEETGTIESVAQGGFIMKTAKSETWNIQLKPGAKVLVDGNAETNYLRPGLNIRLTGEIDKKGALQAEVTELEIFTPQGKTGNGFFADGAPDAKPVRNAAAGSYEIRGKVASFKDNELTMKAGGKTISGKVASDAKVKVSLEDISVAQNGDAVKVKASYLDAYKADGTTRQGAAAADDVSVTLAKPLASKRKATPAKTAKPAKEKKDKKTADATEGGATISDPFGVEKPGDDKPKKGKKPKDPAMVDE
jgi:hypothetical protein